MLSDRCSLYYNNTAFFINSFYCISYKFNYVYVHTNTFEKSISLSAHPNDSS